MFKILILNAFLILHPVHVTIISMNKEPGTDTISMSFRMYYDDFLLDYKLYQPDFDSGRINDLTDYFKNRIINYFNERVKIYLNGKLQQATLSDFSVSNYEILMRLTYRSDIKPKTLRISNKILTGIYADQANMVYLNIEKYENAIKLTSENVETTIKIK